MNKMPHILHVSDRLLIGGKEQMLVDLANKSADDGYAVSVCIVSPGEDLAVGLREGIRIWRLNCVRGLEMHDEEGKSKFSRIVGETGVTILQIHGRPALRFVLASKVKHPVPAPIVFHDHYGGIEVDNSVPAWFLNGAARSISQYVGVCPELASWAEQAGIPERRISVIANAIDMDRLAQVRTCDIRKQLEIPEKVPLGIFIAGQRPNKGLDILLEAMARLLPRWSMKVLVVGGIRNEEYANACREEAHRLGLDPQVLFLGEQLEAFRLLPAVDFAVHPARSESGPLVLIEYAASGVPFVASLTGDIAHRLSSLGVPEFVPPGDATALADALARLLRLSPEEQRHRGRTGAEAVSGEFDIRNRMPYWYEIYRRAADET